MFQADEYYPFGMTFNSYNSGVKNNYLHNQGTGVNTFRTERLEKLQMDMSRYRTYDYALGRWWQIDPKSSGLVEWAPYNYSFNNPIRYSDPEGDCPPGVPCNNPLPMMQVRQNRASNLGPGNVRTNGTRSHHGHDLRAAVGTNVSSTMAGTVVSSYNSNTGYGNTVVIKTNVHPEAQVDFVGPPRAGGAPEQNIYVQYSHLDQRNVNVGDNVTKGQTIGTSGQTGNAQGQAAAEDHLHIQVGTELTVGGNISSSSVVNPNLVYYGVSFESADPSTNQTNTSVIKTTNANGQQTRIYQQVGNQSTSGNSLLLDEVVVTGGGL